jgi:hypothetical protein
MKKTIAFKAAAGMGIEELVWYYWDGNRFTSQYITTFGDEIEDELIRAKIELEKNHAAVATFPENYQFEIKDYSNS